MSKAAILTVSDRAARGEYPDRAGPALRERLEGQGFDVARYGVVPDDVEAVKAKLVEFCDALEEGLVLTTGGTGLSPRDVTPEATAAVVAKTVPGITEAIRAKSLAITKNAMLSRAVAGVRGGCLVINLPGKPEGALESLDIVLDVVPHALAMLRGEGH